MTQRYSAYKDSDVEWIGEIPEHWEVKKLKYISHYNKNTLSDSTDPEKLVNYIEINDVDSSGKVLNTGIFSFKDAPSRARRILAKDDVLISTVRTYLKAIAFVKEEPDNLICSTGFCVLSPMPFLRPKYLYYSCLNEVFLQNVIANSKGVSYPAITATELVGLNIPFPPLYEQSQIVEFLDAKTSLIDKLIDVKQRRIELLKEKRSALINHAVTKGLDPNVKMKDSGIEWIGEIPEHWEIRKLKYRAKIIVSNVDKHVLDNELQIMLCNYTDVYKNEFIDKTVIKDFGSCTEEEFNKFLTVEGDVIITKDSETPSDIGVPALVISQMDRVVCGYHLAILRSDMNKLFGAYLFRQLQTKYVQSYFEVNSNGITRFGLGKSSIESLQILLPPIHEQQQIANYLYSETKKIDDLVTLEQKKIDLLKEYRQALISETVTGKIKVTND